MHLGSCDWVCAAGKITKGCWQDLGISGMAGRWPLAVVILSTINIHNLAADVAVDETFFDHVAPYIACTYMASSQELLNESLLQALQGMSRVFVTRSASLQEGIQHIEGKVVVVSNSNLELISILTKCRGKLCHILT